MSDTNAQEPTMEEILASIRRIISEDDAPAGTEAAASAAEEEEPVGDDDDVLELTEPAPPLAAEPAPKQAAHEPPAAPQSETLGDLEFAPRASPKPPEPAHTPSPSPAPAYRPFASALTPEPKEDEGLVSRPTADQAASAFGQLSRTLTMPTEGRTLEDLVSELLRPLLREWLDQHLSSIVEASVQAEIERVSRRRY